MAEVCIVSLELTVSNEYSKRLVVISKSLTDEIARDFCQGIGWHA